jgi:probable phosphoglycerate mutase
MPGQQVLIIRHGESEWNVERRWQGWSDSPLTPEGLEQAAARGRALAHDGFRPRAIFTSTLLRASRTAEIVAAHLDVPVFAEDGLRERNGGEWEGLTGAEIDERYPGMRDAWRRGDLHAPPGGELDTHALARFDGALTRALAHVGPALFAIVTHGGILRLVAMRAGQDVPALIPNVGGFWFDVVDGRLANPVALTEPAPEEPLE